MIVINHRNLPYASIGLDALQRGPCYHTLIGGLILPLFLIHDSLSKQFAYLFCI